MLDVWAATRVTAFLHIGLRGLGWGTQAGRKRRSLSSSPSASYPPPHSSSPLFPGVLPLLTTVFNPRRRRTYAPRLGWGVRPMGRNFPGHRPTVRRITLPTLPTLPSPCPPTTARFVHPAPFSVFRTPEPAATPRTTRRLGATRCERTRPMIHRTGVPCRLVFAVDVPPNFQVAGRRGVCSGFRHIRRIFIVEYFFFAVVVIVAPPRRTARAAVCFLIVRVPCVEGGASHRRCGRRCYSC